MKVAIDSGPVSSGHAIRGVGFYTKHLISALGKNVEPIDVTNSDLSSYDLIHIPHFNPFVKTFPENIGQHKFVVTIHDLIPLLYPNHYAPGIRGKLRFWQQKSLAQKAGAIITDSETSKKDIMRFLAIDESKIFPIKLAPATHFKKLTDKEKLVEVRKKYSLPEKFVLYVGDINYNKNIPNLVKACNEAKIALVICGKQALDLENLGNDLRDLRGPMDWLRFLLGIPHPELKHYESVLKLVKGNPNVHRLGFVPDEDIVAIYNLATIYCQASFYEGFGLPLVEAFATGLPVVASKTQALVELGQDACLYADPHSAKDIAAKITKMMKDNRQREQCIKKGHSIVDNLSWDRTAKETMHVYQMVAGK